MNVLLIEDNPGDQALFQEALDEIGFECQLNIASSAREAKRFINDEQQDLMVVDIMLPGISGGDFIRDLQIDKRMINVPVIFLSGAIDKSKSMTDVNKVNVGGGEYIAIGKPVSAQQLKNAISRVCSVT